jgi:hypothetical protein
LLARAIQGAADDGSDEESEDETPAEKRLRLAKELIARAEAAERDEVDGHDVDAAAISHRLLDENAVSKGILRRKIAAKVSDVAQLQPMLFDCSSSHLSAAVPVSCVVWPVTTDLARLWSVVTSLFLTSTQMWRAYEPTLGQPFSLSACFVEKENITCVFELQWIPLTATDPAAVASSLPLQPLSPAATQCPATVEEASIRRYRHRGLPVTCLAVVPETQVAFVGSKDGSITKWWVASLRFLCNSSRRLRSFQLLQSNALAACDSLTALPRQKTISRKLFFVCACFFMLLLLL